MEFSGQYLTFNEYKELGGTLDLTPFNILEFESRKKIDERTQRRLKDIQDIPLEVKMCSFNLINSISNYAKSLNNVGDNIASESIDGYSVSYLTTAQIEQIIKSKSIELDDVIRTYLTGVIVNNEHILYLGVN